MCVAGAWAVRFDHSWLTPLPVGSGESRTAAIGPGTAQPADQQWVSRLCFRSVDQYLESSIVGRRRHGKLVLDRRPLGSTELPRDSFEVKYGAILIGQVHDTIVLRLGAAYKDPRTVAPYGGCTYG